MLDGRADVSILILILNYTPFYLMTGIAPLLKETREGGKGKKRHLITLFIT